ncbi:MAG: HipA domain-containing protein [Acholeplasmataceae bacterium]|nr:HipA domain-containing protein [Acholeplasmataceae bacterium]
MIDVSAYRRNERVYTGSEEKFGITIDQQYFIIKFQKNSETGLLNNHISEHLGSSIFNLLGEEAQETSLGYYWGRQVVICKDFNEANSVFTPFNGVGESTLERDKEIYNYTYEDITAMLLENSKMTRVNEVIDRFWNMYIIDALLGNFDRHGANWGFIKTNNTYKMAPIFDNGSSLFPRRNNEVLMLEAMTKEDVIKEMTFTYPTSQIRQGRRKSSYYDIIHSLKFEACNQALSKMVQRIDLAKIFKLIELEEMLSDVQKAFYQYVIQYRYDHIIKESYDRLVGGSNG